MITSRVITTQKLFFLRRFQEGLDWIQRGGRGGLLVGEVTLGKGIHEVGEVTGNGRMVEKGDEAEEEVAVEKGGMDNFLS